MGLRRDQREHISSVLGYTDGTGKPLAQVPNSPLIGRSWQRCIIEYGLDPTQPRSARIVTNQVLREHQDRADELLSVARAGVEQLYQQVAQMGYVLLLTDDRGIAVQYLGDKHKDARLREAGLYLGSDWNESFAGTCAVGTCLRENVSLSCHRTDHFDASHISLTCTSAPIRDADGNCLAVLNISALDSPIAPESQMFSQHLVMFYARMIEDAYFLNRYRNSYILRCDVSREFVRVSGRYLVAMDEDGSILAANTPGRELLERVLDDSAPGWITDVFDCQLRDLWSVPYRNEDQIRAFRTRLTEDTVFATLIQPSRSLSHHRAGSIAEAEEAVPSLDWLGADDPAMRKTLSMAKRLRDEPINVLITGETGTGKELLARGLHESSHRREGAFVAMNCAAIPESLIESELFGYQGGAFTGGRQKGRQGLLQQADGGTLLLDEIGDMPLHLQTRLLRVLAEKEIQPLGADRPVPVNLRVVAATHQDLRRLIAAGEFREDLYYRLGGATLWLPPLRERTDQEYVIDCVYTTLTRNRTENVPRLRGDAVSALLANSWPGNIRELTNVLAFALATARGDEIKARDLPEPAVAPQDPAASPLIAPSGNLSRSTNTTALEDALRRHYWNISGVARELGVSRPTVYRRMRRHGLVPPNWHPDPRIEI